MKKLIIIVAAVMALQFVASCKDAANPGNVTDETSVTDTLANDSLTENSVTVSDSASASNTETKE